MALSIVIIAAAVILSYYSLVASERTSQVVGQTDVYLVLDTSGSMGDPSGTTTKIGHAQASASEFVNIIKPDRNANFTIGLISFDDQAVPLVHLTHDRNSLLNAISSLNADGETALGDALQLAVELLLQEGRQGARRVVLLMSDGLSNADQFSSPEEAANFASVNGIRVFTVAFGSDADTSLLRNIAQQTQGDYYYAGTGAELVQSFSSAAQTLLTVSPEAHYGSRLLMLIALPLIVFLPQVERGITRTFRTLTTIIRKQPGVLKLEQHICPRCGSPLRQWAIFCTRCGLTISKSDQMLTVCRECGKPLRRGARFCTSCGTSV